MATTTDRLTFLLDQQELYSLNQEESLELRQLLETEEGKNFYPKYLATQKALIAAGRDSMKSTIQTWEKEIGHLTSEAKIRRFPRWGGLIAVAAAITMLVLVFRPGGTDSRNSLILELSQPYPNVLMPVERGSVAESTLQEAFAAYEGGEYGEALRLFAEADTASLDLDFYRANALRAEGDTEAALTTFSAIARSSSQFAQQAEWYEAMLLWESGQQEAAESIINRIAGDEQHEMWKRAKRWGG